MIGAYSGCCPSELRALIDDCSSPACQKRNGGENESMNYIGIDVNKKRLVCCVMNPDGSIAEELSCPNTSIDRSLFVA